MQTSRPRSIPISRVTLRAGGLAVILGVACCARPQTSAQTSPPPGADPVTSARHGLIVAARGLPAAPAALGDVQHASPIALGGAALDGVEYVVRLDDGDAVSIVLPGAASLAAGERVAVMAGIRTRLVPLAPQPLAARPLTSGALAP